MYLEKKQWPRPQLISRHTIRIMTILIGLSLLSSSSLNAQDKEKKKKNWFAKRDSIKEARIAEGRGFLSILGGPGYTPELKLIIAIGTLYSFKTDKKDTMIQRSTLNSSFGVTTSGGITSKVILTSFWKQDRIRINTNVWFKNIPDNYWGVGYKDGLDTPKSDSTTAYDRLYWQVNPKFLFRMEKNMYIGPAFDFNQTIAKNESQGVLADSTFNEFGPNNFNGGAGIILQFDSRDIPVNAYYGTLLQFQAVFYGEWLGGDNNYLMLDADFRKYHQLGRIDGQTLAWNIRGRYTSSSTPYAELSQLGTPTDLRGYTWGRFRNNTMIYGIAEYRHMFMKRSGNERGKHGLVGWLAIGTIIKKFDELDDYWLPNLGVGYRLEVQPRMNVRFDLGVGRDNFGFYFNFTEAF